MLISLQIQINWMKRAEAVIFRHKSKTRIVKASKEIILSAGAVGSPQILMLSGIGPSADLKKFDVSTEKISFIFKKKHLR